MHTGMHHVAGTSTDLVPREGASPSSTRRAWSSGSARKIATGCVLYRLLARVRPRAPGRAGLAAQFVHKKMQA